jgi:2-desacetyl-2-hydroxyethyl bacteriochlorophyllide A dehydrogenase
MAGLGLGSSHGIGGLAERVVVPATNVLPVSDTTDLAAASFAEPLANGLRLLDRPEVPGTHGALIIGAGPIGLVSLLAARARGVSGIVVIEGRKRRAEAALALGADRVMSPDDDIEHEVQRSFPGGPPIVIEAVGHPATVMQAMKLTRPGGSAFLMGVCGEPVRVSPFRWMMQELTIRTSVGTDLDRHAEATRLIDSGEVDAGALITSRITLDEAPDAFEALAGGADEIKVVVEHGR